VITVIRELLARSKPRKLSDDTISLHDYLTALAIGNDPFAAPNKNGFGRTIMNRDEINKRKRPVCRRFQCRNITTLSIDTWTSASSRNPSSCSFRVRFSKCYGSASSHFYRWIRQFGRSWYSSRSQDIHVLQSIWPDGGDLCSGRGSRPSNRYPPN